MKTKARSGSSTKELQFELKYCERCGGLWLRPLDGGQIYCVSCSREMAELPPARRAYQDVKDPRMSQRLLWGVNDSDIEDYDEDEGFDGDGGAA